MLIFKSRINQANLRENLKKNILGSVSRFDWDLENNFERINIDIRPDHYINKKQ
jgi:hypothetical protein